MEYQLEMTFETSLGDKVNLTIRNCKSDINEDQIKSLMDTIIAKNIFVTAKGALVSKHSARVRMIEDSKYKFA